MKRALAHEGHFDAIGKVHAKYMVVVPKEVRKSMHLKVGDKVVWKKKAGMAELKPLRKTESDAVEKAYGMLKVKDERKIEKALKRVEEDYF